MGTAPRWRPPGPGSSEGGPGNGASDRVRGRTSYGPCGLGNVTTRWRVRFGYDGTGFRGWARQPGLRTVEGEALRGLWSAGILPRSSTHLEVASRTDRGVSARANALALTTSLPARSLLRLLNGFAPDIYFTAMAPMTEGASIRAALDRTYRYFEDAGRREMATYREAAALFRGRLDVRSFGREVPATAPVWRTVDHVVVQEDGGAWVVEVTAPSFVWGMVRKVVGACREVADGRLPLSRLRRALEGTERLTLPMAEPEALVLWDVRYPDPWTETWNGPNRHQATTLAAARTAARAREAVRSSLSEPELSTGRPR
jgi:tRNA pseudouridine38-40 synthase